MTPELKKIIASAIAAGTLVAGGFSATAPDCDYRVDDVCVSQEQVDAVKAREDWQSIQTWDE